MLTKDSRQNIALPTLGKVSQDELDFQIQNADANEKPTGIPLEHLTALDVKVFEVWYNRNKERPFIQEWLRVIFRCLRASIRDQYSLWCYIEANQGEYSFKAWPPFLSLWQRL